MSDTKTMREALSAAIEAIEADWMANEGRPPYPHELALELMRHPVIHRIQEADRIEGATGDEPERYELFPGINNALDKLTVRRGA